MRSRDFSIRFAVRGVPVRGVTMTEYGLALGLIAIAAVVGVATLGDSISTMLSSSKSATSSGGTLKLLHPVGNAGKAAQSGAEAARANGGSGGYYTLLSDPVTGQPSLQILGGTSDDPTNATSLDGNRMNAIGSMMLASDLTDLAKQQTDPAVATYYEEMAKMTYYLGAAQGEMDEIPGLAIADVGDSGTYSKGNALSDILYYQGQLEKLMQSPPPGAKPQDMAKAIPLAANAYNIAEKYAVAFERFINKDGTVTKNFGFCSSENGCSGGTGAVGSSLELAEHMSATKDMPMIKKRYDQLVSLEEIKAETKNVLSNNQVEAVEVKATLSGAVALDQVKP